MGPLDFIEAARDMTESGRGRPTQAKLRRAVSTVYHAMFHCLAAAVADLFIGRQRTPAWHRAYRALEHGRVRSACLRGQAMPNYPEEIRYFAKTFVALQKARQQADYALDTEVDRKSDVLRYMTSAERAIGRLEQADVGARRGFAAHVVFRQRSW